MPWFPEIAGQAFWDTVQLCRSVIERQQSPKSPWLEILEPSIAEFIAALAAGNKAHHILQIGCGISTIALAAAARATGSYVLSIHVDKDKQKAVNDHVKYLGLVEYVRFMTDEPRNVLPLQEGIDFAFLSGNPECYIELFDLLRLKNGAIVVADNALDEAINEYIKHIHRQPGIRSSTLPLGRGIEVTKILSWNDFRSGRVFYCESGEDIDKVNSCCNYEDMILSDRTLPSSGSKSNYSSNYCLLRDSDQCEECDTERNVLEDTIIFASPFQTVSNCKEAMDGGYLEEVVRETDCSYTCPLQIEGECSYMRSHGVKHPQTDKQLMYINKKEACHMCFVSHTSHLSFTEDSVLNKEKGGTLDKELPTNGFLAGVRLPEATSSEAMPRYLAQDPKDVSVVECPKVSIHKPESEPEQKDSSTSFRVHFLNQLSHTDIIIEGPDQEMLLADITSTFVEIGIIVQRARISTEEELIEDVFCVIDSKTRAPLDPSVWDTVRERMLEKIIAHRRGNNNSLLADFCNLATFISSVTPCLEMLDFFDEKTRGLN